MFESEDDYDFNPSDSSKLSSLFGSFILQNEDTSNSLMYTAPKQPSNSKSQQNADKQPSSSKVIQIKIVSLWKSEDQTYKPLGKHGLAIIGSDELKAYEVIAYKHKTHTILRAKVDDTFCFQQRKDNLSSFIDNKQQNWLVKFETQEQQLEFGDHLKLYRAKILLEHVDTEKEQKKDQKPLISSKPERSSNDLDSDSSDSTRKANILSRITKMGQQVVPKPMPALESDISDENESHESKTRKFRKVKKFEREETQHIPETINTELVQKPLLPASQVPYVYYPHTTIQPQYGDLSSMILAQNTELRCSLNEISQKLDNINSHGKGSTTNLSTKVKVLELRTENLQSELQRYKQKCFHLESQSTVDCSKKDEKSLEISRLKQTIEQLNSRLSDAKIKVDDLESCKQELAGSQAIILEQKKTIDSHKHSLEELDLLYQKAKTSNMECNSLITNLNEQIKEYETLIQRCETEKSQLQQKKLLHIDFLTDLVKASMNTMYQSILHSLDEDGSYSFSDVQSVIARNLKDTSFRIINGVKGDLESEVKNVEKK